MGDQTGPVAVVTGANRGIGREVAARLAADGHRTVLGVRDVDRGRAAARGMTGDVTVAELDVADPGSVTRFAGWLRQHHGRVDVLVNNAAVTYDTWQDPLSADLDLVRDTLDVNALGAWRVAQALAPLMRHRSPGRRIVNVSSESGSLTGMGAAAPAYAMSKAALNALTRLLAAQLAGDGVLVNSVCPGWVATDMGGPAAPRTVAEGAASVLWAVRIPDDGPTGGFFRDGRPLPW
ncbi:short-subunit dehydrogenase [Micromonospora kangleipakensis]|uniref:Short-subunit dehydrogenase n=1 Tax=Micromonospora kangleipakensis TaxID=1077942 RepID=A0A4Q8BEW7_9ACTN|nr:SDR family NAD(P)-dependent oxidoreductase [Micromonospora kangleipakensis]RZU75773.1 short-subunit dehydrogenase [Micromonospora kangleipakensis]